MAMSERFLIYYSDFPDPYRNLAAEEQLTKNVRAGEPILFLWQNTRAVVIGKNQNSRAECDLLRMERDGVLLSRRLSGGGAVYHDTGNLCFSFISRADEHDVASNLALIADACAEFGIAAETSGRNDMTVGGRKFSGNAFYSIGQNKCHHGTVLISSDFGRLAEYLTIPESKLEAKGIRSVRSRVINLAELCRDLTPERFARTLISLCGGDIRRLLDDLPISERADFFASDEWLFGCDPEFTDEVKYRTAEGEFTLLLTVNRGTVTDCRVYTDSLDPAASDLIRSRVLGQPFANLKMIKE